MTKLGVVLRLILTVLLLAYPVSLGFRFLYNFLAKYITQLLGTFRDRKVMHQIKEELIDNNIIEEENQDFVDDEPTTEEELLSVPENESYTHLDQGHDVVGLVEEAVAHKDHELSEEEKELQKKKKKEIEKIVYQALVLRKEGKLDEYEKKVIEGLVIDPDDRDLNKLLADYYFNLGNYKKALSLLKKIVEQDPSDHKAIWQIGEMYLISGDFETAELLVEKAISLNQSNPKYYISMVEILYNTDRKKYAIEVMEKVVKLRPTNTVYLLTLADLCYEVQDFDTAKKNYFRVLEYEPTNEKAKSKLRSLS